jgi:hypothetical protein
MIINGEEYFTVKEMAESLEKSNAAVKQLLHKYDLKPVSKDAIYTKAAFDKLKEIPPWGWVKGRSRKKPEE